MGRLIPITDSQGRIMLNEFQAFEPHPGSVVLTDGEYGTAWQRHFGDGRWHSTTRGGSKTWAELLTTRRNVLLAYDAPERSRDGNQRPPRNRPSRNTEAGV